MSRGGARRRTTNVHQPHVVRQIIRRPVVVLLLLRLSVTQSAMTRRSRDRPRAPPRARPRAAHPRPSVSLPLAFAFAADVSASASRFAAGEVLRAARASRRDRSESRARRSSPCAPRVEDDLAVVVFDGIRPIHLEFDVAHARSRGATRGDDDVASRRDLHVKSREEDIVGTSATTTTHTHQGIVISSGEESESSSEEEDQPNRAFALGAAWIPTVSTVCSGTFTAAPVGGRLRGASAAREGDLALARRSRRASTRARFSRVPPPRVGPRAPVPRGFESRAPRA